MRVTIRIKIFISSALALLLLHACSKNKTETYDFKSSAYYNYQTGNIRDYDLDSISYDWASGKTLKYHFLVRERVLESYVDLSGKQAVRIEQYISRDTGRTFEIYAVNTAIVEPTGFQRTEDNQRYQKIITPITVKRKWNGNLYNNLGFKEFQFASVGSVFANKYNEFLNCVVVMQQNDSSFISHDKEMEIYAKDQGLAYRYIKHVVYHDSDKAEGFITEWNLKKYWEK